MEYAAYLPIWDKLTPAQQQRIGQVISYHNVKKGTTIHDSSADCLGLVLIRRRHSADGSFFKKSSG